MATLAESTTAMATLAESEEPSSDLNPPNSDIRGVRYTDRPVQVLTCQPEQYHTFWQAQAAECVASSRMCDQALGALALKYGLGTKYDPFLPSDTATIMRKPAAASQR
jgi:hypothetical protein